MNYAVTKVKGAGEVMDYEAFLQTVFSETPTPTPAKKKKKTAEEITAQFMPFVEADKRKGG